jgi:hypothetical protein
MFPSGERGCVRLQNKWRVQPGCFTVLLVHITARSNLRVIQHFLERIDRLEACICFRKRVQPLLARTLFEDRSDLPADGPVELTPQQILPPC